LRDAFNIGYDVILISDATASGINKHYETTLERVRDYYGLVMTVERFFRIVNSLKKVMAGEVRVEDISKDVMTDFLKEFNLLDIQERTE
jgi:ureidoacrylate peracid hydrolase